MSKTVLILGANGRLGRAAVTAFANAGWEVFAQSRRPLLDPAKTNVSQVAVSLDEVASEIENRGGADIVVNGLNPLYTQWQTNALPLAKMAALIALRLNATLIFPGNVYNFGEQMPHVLTENTPQTPTTEKGMIRCQMEQYLQDSIKLGLRCIVVRAGDFVGDWNLGTWLDMAIMKDLAKKRVAYPGPKNVVHSWAYLPDLARTMVALAEARAQLAAYEVFNFPGYSLTGQQLINALTQAAQNTHLISTNENLKVNSFPWPLLEIGGLVIPMWRELTKMRYLWNVPHQLNGDKLANAIGTIPHTAIEAVLEDLMAQAGLMGFNEDTKSYSKAA